MFYNYTDNSGQTISTQIIESSASVTSWSGFICESIYGHKVKELKSQPFGYTITI